MANPSTQDLCLDSQPSLHVTATDFSDHDYECSEDEGLPDVAKQAPASESDASADVAAAATDSSPGKGLAWATKRKRGGSAQPEAHGIGRQRQPAATRIHHQHGQHEEPHHSHYKQRQRLGQQQLRRSSAVQHAIHADDHSEHGVEQTVQHQLHRIRRSSMPANLHAAPEAAVAACHAPKAAIPRLGCSKCRYAANGCRKCREDQQAALDRAAAVAAAAAPVGRKGIAADAPSVEHGDHAALPGPDNAAQPTAALRDARRAKHNRPTTAQPEPAAEAAAEHAANACSQELLPDLPQHQSSPSYERASNRRRSSLGARVGFGAFAGLSFLLTGFTAPEKQQLECTIRRLNGYILPDIPKPQVSVTMSYLTDGALPDTL